jgi:hypothetical protein
MNWRKDAAKHELEELEGKEIFVDRRRERDMKRENAAEQQ